MARAQTPPRAREVTSESVVARGARIRGRVSGDGSLLVQGEIAGDVALTGDLTIDDGGSLEGDVDAGAVIVAGALTGDVAAKNGVTIRSSARVSGNMGGEVTLEEGASFSGRIEAEFDLPAELTHKGR